MAPLIKNPYDFYKVLTFKWHVSKFEPNQIISLQIRVIWVKLLLLIFKAMEKSAFRVLIKHCFLMGKNTVQAKQWLDKCYSDSASSEITDTNDAEHSGRPNSPVVSENTKKLHKLVLANHKLKLNCREIKDIRRQCTHHFTRTFVNDKAVFKVGAASAHNRSKTMCQQFRALFATVSMQQKVVFA